MFSTRIAASALRAPIARSFTRLALTTPQRPLLTSLCKTAIARQPRFAAPFSTTPRQRSDNAVDEELALKLEAELKLESEIKEFDEAPEVVREFLEASPFTLNDKPGQNEVELVRKFNDETIRVTFTISDINHQLEEDGSDPLYDEVAEDADGRPVQSEGGASGSSSQNKATPEEEEFDEEEDTPAESFPARVDVTIEKPSRGALLVEAIAQDGMIVIENVLYHKNASLLASLDTAEADWQRRGTYGGPPFGNLDEDLQVLFERYLDERGINTSLALFIPEYIDHKEQKEYLKWLENVKGFVSA